ncbi:tail fiber assembly protein [Mixta calida]|uniref:tail fiber assembly protein n=1 Tax=Mixta calida TaxID=665913 RepID=UPI00290F2419|nr:tail fiber assembly protein [Mixta calida]MDU4291137.1 tail fiber assembly protein [Mixta calida]
MYMYSAKNNAFYPLSLKENYEAAGSWPDDGKEVGEDVFSTFTNPVAGKTRVAGKDGLPAWEDVPPPSQEQLVSSATAQKTAMLAEANASTQAWQTQLLLGIITDTDKASLTTWMRYYQQVQSVDTSKAPDISWPAKPD